MGASVAGGVIAFYQYGYGIAAFGAGALVDAGGGRRPVRVRHDRRGDYGRAGLRARPQALRPAPTARAHERQV